MDRDYYLELGGYDPGMGWWGAENGSPRFLETNLLDCNYLVKLQWKWGFVYGCAGAY